MKMKIKMICKTGEDFLRILIGAVTNQKHKLQKKEMLDNNTSLI